MGEELYELPEGWVWSAVGEICTTTSGGTPSRKDNTNFGGKIPWLKSGELDNRIIKATEEFITDKGLSESSTRIIPKGTLLIAMYGATVGRLGILGIDAAINQAICAIFIPKQLNQKYLYFYLIHFKDNLLNARKGGAQPNISQQIVNDIYLPLPPLPEQHRIVDKIEELFTELDAGVELLKKLKAKLKRYRQAVLKAAVEGNLTKEWRTANQGKLEPASVLLERILKQRREKWEAEQLAKMKAQGKPPKDDSWKLKYKEPIAPDTSDLPELPDGWVWVNLGQITWSVKDGPHYSPKYVDEGIPFITGGNVRPSGVDFANAKRITPELYRELSKKCKPEKGDILYTKGGTTGIARVNTYDIEFNVWVHVAVLKLAGLVEPFYIQHSLNSPFCYSQSQHFTHGVGNQDLGLTRMIKIVLSLPPQDEQKKIIDEIEYLYSVIDQLEKTIDFNLKRAEKLRQSILKQAFEGKLVPQDSNDEPAEKLLERIKAEKAKQTTTKTKKKTQSKKQSDLQLEIPLK
jgi:type I restriction enzyme S subunit